MNKWIIFLISSAMGSLGWWSMQSFGIGWAFIASGIGSLVGIFIGWWLLYNFF